MIIPEGKTKVVLRNDVHQSELKENDVGYIDGYVQAADSRGYAVVVRLSDGLVEIVSICQIKATPRIPDVEHINYGEKNET